MQKPIAYLPAHLNVEEDVAPIKTFIQDTNCIVMKRHGITVLGRNVSECYHRVNTYASEVKRQIIVELLCAAKGTTARVHQQGRDGVDVRAGRRGRLSEAHPAEREQ